MGEPSGLACPSINGHTNVDYVLDVPEKVVEVFISHLKRHVADEQSLRRGILGAGIRFRGPLSPYTVLHRQAAAFKDLLVQSLNSFGGRVTLCEFNVSEPTLHQS